MNINWCKTAEENKHITSLLSEWKYAVFLSDLTDYKSKSPVFVRDVSHGNQRVFESKLTAEHHFFSKLVLNRSVDINKFVLSRLALELGLPVAPTLFGFSGKDRHGIEDFSNDCVTSHVFRMATGRKVGSLFEVLLHQIEHEDSKVPDILKEKYDEIREQKSDNYPIKFIDFVIMGFDVRQALDKWKDPYFEINKEFISKYFTFSWWLSGGETFDNIGNIIVDFEDPSRFLYMIDDEYNPILRGGRNPKMLSVAEEMEVDEHIDAEIVKREIESFRSMFTDDVEEQIQSQISNLEQVFDDKVDLNISDIRRSLDRLTL